MELISVSDFLNLTKLSERAFIAMLESGELSTATGPLGELLIDISQVTPNTIARRSAQRKRSVSDADLALLEEMIAAELIRSLSELIDEAFALALSWSEKKDNPA